MAQEIGVEWIQIACENYGRMAVATINGKFRAVMRWRGREDVYGEDQNTVASAIESLDTALAEDAANEMIDSGAV